jgi:D-alanine-D-alanine ligase-like ATP-grasp enzyme
MRKNILAGMAVAAICPGLLTGATAAAARTPAAAASRAASGGRWGSAEEVPGLRTLNQGAFAQIDSVSCASAGNCSAGGYYEANDSGDFQAFVVSETNGSWDTAEKVPGLAALNQDTDAEIHSVSCASAGNCSAGGFYTDGSEHTQAFVVDKTNGTWGTAQEVPGTAALNKGGVAVIFSVSCASAGNCSAGGYYANRVNHEQGLVVDETNGTWGTAQKVPGLAALNKKYAGVTSMSCASAGNCSAGGYYTYDSELNDQAFVVSETNGTWHTAEEVPGTAALNTGGAATVNSVSCVSAGHCSAGGSYVDSSFDEQSFVVGEKNGTWGIAEEVPGTAALSKGVNAGVHSVSCASAGNCGAGGQYTNSFNHEQAFVVGEKNGTWGTAEEVPGTAALNAGGNAQITSVSCASAGNCSAGGYYTDSSGANQAFVVGETNGTWGTAEEVPGTAALNAGGNAQITSVSCASAGNCSAGGYYGSISPGLNSGGSQAFVVGETNGT